jgi:carbonic anhydrase
VRTLDLSIVGYVACGPIRAVTCNYSRESDAIKHELNGKQIAIKADEISEDNWLRGVISNLNNQVNYALIKFADEVKEDILTVVGAVYDL